MFKFKLISFTLFAFEEEKETERENGESDLFIKSDCLHSLMTNERTEGNERRKKLRKCFMDLFLVTHNAIPRTWLIDSPFISRAMSIRIIE